MTYTNMLELDNNNKKKINEIALNDKINIRVKSKTTARKREN